MVTVKRIALPAAVVVATFFSKGARGDDVSGGLSVMFAVDSTSVGVGCVGSASILLSFIGLIISGIEVVGKAFSTTPSVDNAGVGKITSIGSGTTGRVDDAIAGVEVVATGKVEVAVEVVFSPGSAGKK